MSAAKKRSTTSPTTGRGIKPKGVDSRVLEYLANEAKEAQKRAYAPYSRYRVGAAILTRAGRVYKGCNFENASYGACICAERCAIGNMCASGDREPIACVIVTNGKTPAAPCGICRQVLAEFAEELPILLIGVDGKRETRLATTLSALLPLAFRSASLKKR